MRAHGRPSRRTPDDVAVGPEEILAAQRRSRKKKLVALAALLPLLAAGGGGAGGVVVMQKKARAELQTSWDRAATCLVGAIGEAPNVTYRNLS